MHLVPQPNPTLDVGQTPPPPQVLWKSQKNGFKQHAACYKMSYLPQCLNGSIVGTQLKPPVLENACWTRSGSEQSYTVQLQQAFQLPQLSTSRSYSTSSTATESSTLSRPFNPFSTQCYLIQSLSQPVYRLDREKSQTKEVLEPTSGDRG